MKKFLFLGVAAVLGVAVVVAKRRRRMIVKDLRDLEILCKRLGVPLREYPVDRGEVYWDSEWDEDGHGLYVTYTGFYPAEVNAVLITLRRLEQAGYIKVIKVEKANWNQENDADWIFLGAVVEIIKSEDNRLGRI
jgi:hypothetical protein